MKALALALWFVAVALLVCVLQMDSLIRPRSDAFLQAGRSLLAIAPATAVLVPLPAPAPAPVSVSVSDAADPVAGCSRLGIFPRRDWAERVAIILTDATSPVPADSALRESRLIEETPTQPWRVQRVGLDAYYLQFEAWGIDELAARMTQQRGLLKKLLSISAIPEAC